MVKNNLKSKRGLNLETSSFLKDAHVDDIFRSYPSDGKILAIDPLTQELISRDIGKNNEESDILNNTTLPNGMNDLLYPDLSFTPVKMLSAYGITTVNELLATIDKNYPSHFYHVLRLLGWGFDYFLPVMISQYKSDFIRIIDKLLQHYHNSVSSETVYDDLIAGNNTYITVIKLKYFKIENLKDIKGHR